MVIALTLPENQELLVLLQKTSRYKLFCEPENVHPKKSRNRF